MKKEIADLRVNGKCDMHEVRKTDKGKVSMRINSNTVILVKPENATDDYKEEYKLKIK